MLPTLKERMHLKLENLTTKLDFKKENVGSACWSTLCWLFFYFSANPIFGAASRKLMSQLCSQLEGFFLMRLLKQN